MIVDEKYNINTDEFIVEILKNNKVIERYKSSELENKIKEYEKNIKAIDNT